MGPELPKVRVHGSWVVGRGSMAAGRDSGILLMGQLFQCG